MIFSYHFTHKTLEVGTQKLANNVIVSQSASVKTAIVCLCHTTSSFRC